MNNKESFEKTAEIFENNYQNYVDMGAICGNTDKRIINEEDYQSAIDRMNKMPALDKDDPKVRDTIRQVVNMAKHTKINLSGLEDARVRLYVILRKDVMPKEINGLPKSAKDQRTSLYHDGISPSDAKPKDRHHYSQLSNQKIFVEALRMLGDVESRDIVIDFYKTIDFKHDSGE